VTASTASMRVKTPGSGSTPPFASGFAEYLWPSRASRVGSSIRPMHVTAALPGRRDSSNARRRLRAAASRVGAKAVGFASRAKSRGAADQIGLRSLVRRDTRPTSRRGTASAVAAVTPSLAGLKNDRRRRRCVAPRVWGRRRKRPRGTARMGLWRLEHGSGQLAQECRRPRPRQ
jgi:hypothetical protein